MTGGGFGPCAGHDVLRRSRRGGGRGRGRGWRNWYHATGLPRWARSASQVSKEDKAQALEAEAQYLSEQLEAIQGRLAELKE
jgi:hypothetical protein